MKRVKHMKPLEMSQPLEIPFQKYKHALVRVGSMVKVLKIYPMEVKSKYDYPYMIPDPFFPCDGGEEYDNEGSMRFKSMSEAILRLSIDGYEIGKDMTEELAYAGVDEAYEVKGMR